MKTQIRIFVILLSVLNIMPAFVSTCNATVLSDFKPDLSQFKFDPTTSITCAQKVLPEHAAKGAKMTGTPPDCKVSGCEDGYKLSSDGTKCISKLKTKIKNSKEACEKSDEGIVKGKWLGASCKCPKGSKLNDGGNCKQNTGTCSSVYGKGKGTYDEKGNCKIKICGDKNYTPNKEGTSCELKTTNNIKEKEENKKTFLSYADKIHTNFISKLTALQSQDKAKE